MRPIMSVRAYINLIEHMRQDLDNQLWEWNETNSVKVIHIGAEDILVMFKEYHNNDDLYNVYKAHLDAIDNVDENEMYKIFYESILQPYATDWIDKSDVETLLSKEAWLAHTKDVEILDLTIK